MLSLASFIGMHMITCHNLLNIPASREQTFVDPMSHSLSGDVCNVCWRDYGIMLGIADTLEKLCTSISIGTEAESFEDLRFIMTNIRDFINLS